MFARLGVEAADALEEFLELALDYERREPPSLQGFLAWLRSADAVVKRDMEISRDEVRVMTVHGAKGLEAPVVILADTTTPPAGPHAPAPAGGAAAARRAGGAALPRLARSQEGRRRSRRHRAGGGEGRSRGRASPAALRRHDPRRGAADRVRQPGQEPSRRAAGTTSSSRASRASPASRKSARAMQGCGATTSRRTRRRWTLSGRTRATRPGQRRRYAMTSRPG